MPKNIFIFADGTGQIGGLRPDQKLSNVYKMYRAVRPGPTSPISYNDQVAYYDPGLGAGEMEGITGSKVKNLLESAVGAGIEDNMIDCYAKIIAFYEPGDRIILIGFSRGAYTVRALANMMNLCGVPTKLEDGSPMPRNGKNVRRVATEAVKSVYGHGTGRPRGETPFLQQREEKGRRFRVKYGCEACDGSDNLRGNVEPAFIGVFDTVAALQNGAVNGLIKLAFWLNFFTLAFSIYVGWPLIVTIILGAMTGLAIVGYVKTFISQIRFYEPDPENPLRVFNPFHWKALLANTHRAYWRKQNYDRWLSPAVGYARHALAIDERRADFPRVKWAMPNDVRDKGEQKPVWLKQLWFAGCHSDVGGSYPEDESRLSDIAMQWMIDELRECVPEVLIRDCQIVTCPDPLGLQHEQTLMFKRGIFSWKWKLKPRLVESYFNLHPSVSVRLNADVVPHEETLEPYRPVQLANHEEASRFFRSN
jgi:hypothetical protein